MVKFNPQIYGNLGEEFRPFFSRKTILNNCVGFQKNQNSFNFRVNKTKCREFFFRRVHGKT
ncbi:hypothetical protein ACM44_10020 [Chryseobacterium koreense CCUG 49689]|uniref:Uncharacterized protein n=1 Tax=Chryseobacterium koreense CCUG 49689 TaxID=1304281 RepID=A0A0J7IY67_9FLAO|nr:hypothetical protein ACM44_10020 [Chryseobacterium koreense CCUG 49689]